ncbi:MAG: hypothetical protein KDK27_20690, partial [Leptospiraceae bacterium]|nr:hypothetical protein [Leptospiraceae bacterium]
IAGHRFFVPGSGENRKSFLHVSDAAQVIAVSAARACDLGEGQIETLNVAAPAVTVAQVANAIALGLGQRPPVRVPMPLLRFPMAMAGLVPPLRSIADSVKKLASNDVLDTHALSRAFPDLALRDTVTAMEECAADAAAIDRA